MSLLATLVQADRRLRMVRRTITRPAKADEEAYEPVTVAAFEKMQKAGRFCLHWQAHGLYHGVRAALVAPQVESV